MKLRKSLPVTVVLFAVLALVAGEGCTRKIGKGSLNQRLFKPRAAAVPKPTGRKVAEGNPDWLATNAFFALVNDPQGEVDSDFTVFKGVEGLNFVVSYPKTQGVECAVGENKGREDSETGRVVFEIAGDQEIVCRNIGMQPLAEVEVQYMVSRVKLDWSALDGGEEQAKLVAAKKELTEGKFNGGLVQYLEQFGLMATSQITIKANTATPTELKISAKSGDYIQFAPAGGRIARRRGEAARIGPAGLDAKNAKKLFGYEGPGQTPPDCTQPKVAKVDKRCGLVFPGENPYALVCTDTSADGKTRVVTSGGTRFETNQVTKLACAVNGVKKQVKSAVGEFGVKVIVGDAKAVAARIDALLQGNESMKANLEKAQDEKNLATVRKYLEEYSRQSLEWREHYKKLAVAREQERLKKAEANAKDLARTRKDQVLNQIFDPTGAPMKPRNLSVEELEKMEKLADEALQKIDRDKFKNPRVMSETFRERYFLFSVQMRPFKSDGATSFIDFVLSDTQSVYLSEEKDEFYTPLDPFAPYTLIPSSGFYVESRIPAEERKKKAMVACAKDLPALVETVKGFNHLVENGENAASPETIQEALNKFKASEASVCPVTDAPEKVIPTYKRLRTYRFCYEEKEKETFNGRIKYTEWVFTPSYIETYFKSAALRKQKSQKIMGGSHPFFSTKVSAKASIGGPGCVNIDEFMPLINPDGRIVGGTTVAPTDPVDKNVTYAEDAKPEATATPAPTATQPAGQIVDPWEDEGGSDSAGK